MNQIYYIEDDVNIAYTVKEYLEQRDFEVLVFMTIMDARKAFSNHVPDIVLMDWNMPDGRGDILCQWIRARWQELPVIFLTVRGDCNEIVTGFQSGADDYVVKPFDLEVLYSRICAILRRAGNKLENSLTCDTISIDQDRMMVFNNGDEITLSQSEYQLLLLLLRNKGRTMTRDMILKQIWDSNGSYVNDNTLTVTMKRLREKLNQPSCIKTVRSFGYRMEDTI